MNYKHWTPQELEFMAENEIIWIIPNFKERVFQFVSGSFGPFRPAKPVQVPIWLAIYLKQRNKCQVQLPHWLDYDYLKKIKSYEQESGEQFCNEIPYYYYEIANLLFTSCGDEFPQADKASVSGGKQASGLQKVKSIIEDIHEFREEKILKQMKQIDTTTPCKSLSFAGSSEINLVKPAFTLGYGVAM